MPSDPRIRITGPTQYDELDRAFGVPDPANGTTPQAQRPMTTAEQAASLTDQAADLVDTANLGRLEELTNALEVLYRDGVGYPFRDAIGELGHNLSTARMHLARARRMYAEELDRLKTACDQWADDYRTVDRMAQEQQDLLVTEAHRRRSAEEVLRHLEELPGFLDEPHDVGVGYRIDTENLRRLRALISAHTATVAGADPGPQPGSPRQHPEPNLGCATSLELLTELTTRFEIHRTEATDRLLAADTCRRLADHLDETTLSYRTIDG